MILTFACLLVESLFELSQLLLVDLSELVNCALPTLALEIVVDFRLHDDQEESFLVFGTFLGKDRSILSQDSKFHLDLFYITQLHQLIKDIAHDRDEHVEHGDLSEKGGAEEHTNHQTRCSTHHEVLANLELAQHQQVLVVDSVHHPPSKALLYNELLSIIPAQIEHVDWQAKHEHGGEKQDQEPLDLRQSCSQQLHVKGRVLEQPHPVVEFHNEEATGKGSQLSEVLHWDPCLAKDGLEGDHCCNSHSSDVYPVPQVAEVLHGLYILQLQNICSHCERRVKQDQSSK